MKRDGRTFDHQTLEAIQLIAIQRVREGEHPADVIASYGFNWTTIYKWIHTARKAGDSPAGGGFGARQSIGAQESLCA